MTDSVAVQRLANNLKLAASTAADRCNDVAIATSPTAAAAAVEHAARAMRDVLRLGRALTGTLAPARKKDDAADDAEIDTIDTALDELAKKRGRA